MNTEYNLCQGNMLMLHNLPKPVLNMPGIKKKKIDPLYAVEKTDR